MTESARNDNNIALFISLSFCPNENLVTAISQLVSDFCRIGLADSDISFRFRMAAHELAENITRYSTTSRVSLEVELFERDNAHYLRVRTRNETSPDRIEEMRARLDQLKTTKDPEELYDQMIEDTAPLEGVSGLGLVRIRAEGELDFDYTIEGNLLTVEVEGPVPEPIFRPAAQVASA